ncbi:hypothetical protein ABPG72_005483 [Tetrahymena utriculariae]
MGSNCVSESKKLCQNDMQISTNIQNQPTKLMSETINRQDMEISSNRLTKKSNSNYDSRNNCEGIEGFLEEYFAKNEELIEFEQVGEFPFLNIAFMKDIKMIKTKQFDIESQNCGQNKLLIQSMDISSLVNQQYQLYYDGQVKKMLIQQHLKIIQKPCFGQIIKHVLFEPQDSLIYSYNKYKNIYKAQNANKTKFDIEKQSQSEYCITEDFDFKKKKLTLILNSHQIQDQEFIINVIQQKLYHLSIKLNHKRHQNFLNNILQQTQSKKLSLEIQNIDYRLQPYSIPSLNCFKINLQGFNCSSNNFEFQESLFFFYCCNSLTIQTLKIKARKCSINHFFSLLEGEILSQKFSALNKISLDLIFFGQFQNDIRFIQSMEKLLKEAIYIQIWNISFKFKEIVAFEAAGEFEKNSHASLCESYLITQPKESFIQNRIDQSSFLSPIIKHKDVSPKQNIKKLNLDTKLKQQQTSLQSFDQSANKMATSQNKRPSNLKKNIKQNNIVANHNKPFLMMMQEIKQTHNQQIDHNQDSIQEQSNQSYTHMPKSPERVTFANNNEVPYSTIKHIEQMHHQQIVRQRNKSLFLDSSISVGIDLINEKQFEERIKEYKSQFFNQFSSNLILLSIKQVKKLALLDESGKYNIENNLQLIQNLTGLKQLQLTFTLSEDTQFYSLQNLLKNNQNTLQKFYLSMDKNIIVSVFDDQRLFNLLEKIQSLRILEINYQTADFIPKYIFKMKNLLYFKDLYQHKIALNKNNPFLNQNLNNNKLNQKRVNQQYSPKQENFNQLILYLKETSLLTFKSKQLYQNIPESLFNVLSNHFLKRKIFFYQLCLARNYKIKQKNTLYDLFSFYI